MKRCEHDPIFSGATNLDRRFACICRKCGNHWWNVTYDIAQVDLDQYLHLRVLHGWDDPRKLPPPPRVPVFKKQGFVQDLRWVPGVIWFAGLFVVCGAMGVPWLTPWGIDETPMPIWIAMVSSGASLLMATLCYLGWKRGW